MDDEKRKKSEDEIKNEMYKPISEEEEEKTKQSNELVNKIDKLRESQSDEEVERLSDELIDMVKIESTLEMMVSPPDKNEEILERQKQKIKEIETLAKETKKNIESQSLGSPEIITNQTEKSSENSFFGISGLNESNPEFSNQFESSPITSIVVSDNGRIKCIIEKLLKRSNNPFISSKEFYDINFLNCAVLKVHLEFQNNIGNKQYSFSVEMVYSGSENDNDEPSVYWSNQKEDLNFKTFTKKSFFGMRKKEQFRFAKFQKIVGDINLNQLTDVVKGNWQPPTRDNFTIYLCNSAAKSKMKKQNSIYYKGLTDVGIKEARKLGDWFKEELNGIYPFFFVSDQLNSQSTGEEISFLIDEKEDYFPIILPCSHNVKGKIGNCDNYNFFSSEMEDADVEEEIIRINKRGNITRKIRNIEYYKPYNRVNKKFQTKKCRYTNLFILIIEIVKKEKTDPFIPPPIRDYLAGKRKTRKNKKGKKRKSYKKLKK